MLEGASVRLHQVTRQGSRLLRWALGEAIQRVPATSMIGSAKQAIIARRGTQARDIAKVAAARKLLTLVYYGLRDGQIRVLAKPAAAHTRSPAAAARRAPASGQARGRGLFRPAPSGRASL
jgi:hypothetical protein